MTLTASQIRSQFIAFFQERAGHTFAPSSPVVPHNDPTLLFTNAGMNQFKDVFLATGSRPYTRAVNSQKCIRAGGKHNDLEDVGRDTYHHTFFEMLGNWSFGDYFKKEAIAWAWELLVTHWKIDPERLHATYFEGDAAEGLEPDLEARDLWLQYLPAERIHPGNKKDNFWEMGDTGPCGPCSEIHYDGTEDKNGGVLVNAGDPRVIEIWNLVFIQFNRGSDGRLTPLPAKHVDTGMGFERIVRVIQNRQSNYDTDIWAPVFAAIEQRTGARAYTGRLDDPIDIAYRVIADHIRCLTVAITDGATPGNEGRGYVLRRILRRAVRMAHQYLGAKGPLLCKLVPAVVESLGEAFPELKKDAQRVAAVIQGEEEAFLKTLERGMQHFNDAALPTSRDRKGAVAPAISAADAFKLHDTYGFPIDLTRVMAEERGLTVDTEGFERLMDEARAKSRAGGVTTDGDEPITLQPDHIASLASLNIPPTDDADKYHARTLIAEIRAIFNGRNFDDNAPLGRRVAVILDRTNHYAEQGGQVGDVGTMLVTGAPANVGELRLNAPPTPITRAARFEIEDTHVTAGYVLHIGRSADGSLRVGDKVSIKVANQHREPVRANHTATHLLNLALREALGDGVNQKGSLVASDRLRFDFSHNQALTVAELQQVQDKVNADIKANLKVSAEIAPLESARAIHGLRAVFGERYPDPVRVVAIGVSVNELLANPGNTAWQTRSIEFCGGTHLETTAAAGAFIIQSEGALAAGVRRITAVTGPAAMAANAAAASMQQRITEANAIGNPDAFLTEIADITRLLDELNLGVLARQKLITLLEPLRERAKDLRKKSQSVAQAFIKDQAKAIAEQTSGSVIVEQFDNADRDALLAAMDVLTARRPEAAALLLSADEAESKVTIVAAVPKELIAKGLKAGDWVKEVAAIVEGSGGGKPDRAQAGGKNPAKTPEALQHAKSFASKKINPT